VSVGLVGLGHWGPNLARNFDELGTLVALCDLDAELRERFAARYPNAGIYADYGEMLAAGELDAVVVATPVPTHFALSKQALEAGKHVFVEKPPAMRATEMEELVALAAERNLVLLPGHLLLYHPGVQKVKLGRSDIAEGVEKSGRFGDRSVVAATTCLFQYPDKPLLQLRRAPRNPLGEVGIVRTGRNARIRVRFSNEEFVHEGGHLRRLAGRECAVGMATDLGEAHPLGHAKRFIDFGHSLIRFIAPREKKKRKLSCVFWK